MTLEFGDLAAGVRLSGAVADTDVTVVAVEMHGTEFGDSHLSDR